MNVLFAIKSMLVEGGGAERVLADVANGLAARGHRVGILTFDYAGQPFYALDERITLHNAACNRPGTPTSLTSFLAALPRMRHLVRKARPDVVVSFMHSTFVPVVLASAGLGLSHIYSEHTDARHYEGRPIQRRLLNFLRKGCAFSVVPSAAARDTFPPDQRQDFAVISNPLDAGRFSHVADVDADDSTVLSVGRFWPEKNHITLLRAFARVLPQFPSWTLRIVGEGSMRSELEAEIACLGIGANVALPGITRDMPAAYAAASFVAIPSLYESFGMVAAEALASRRAVLAFDNCSGIAEIVHHQVNGLLVPGNGSAEHRVGAMAEGLRCLMANPALRHRLAAAGPDSVGQLGLGPVLDAWEEVCARACGKRTR